MSTKKILVVFGATGTQGGSVIDSILGDPKASQEFQLRGITRDPSKPNAKALAARGVECVTGDTNDKASLKKAFHGAHTVFAVTNYWEKMDDKLEVQQGKNIADACKEENVQHLIFSTLYNVTKLTQGKYSNVYHFDSKASITDYIRSLGIPSSSFMPGFYLPNLESMFNPSPQEPHAYTLALPMPPSTLIPWFAAAQDTGKFVKAMALKRDEVLGKEVLASTTYLSAEAVVDIFRKVKPETGKGATFVTIDEDTFRGFLSKAGMPDFATLEMYENMAFMDEFGYYGKKSLDWSLSLLDEKPTTIEEFFTTGKWKDMK